jgi:hypothetical protein
MGRNAKRKGSRNERRSRDLLEAAGYRVTRAAGGPEMVNAKRKGGGGDS